MVSRAILYYSDCRPSTAILKACQNTIVAAGLPIVSVTLGPMDFGTNIFLPLERSYKSMFRQIVTGLSAITEDVVYFCEHDTLYHPSHFEFTPSNDATFYYNGNYWFLRLSDGFAIHYDASPLGGLVAYRKPLLVHFEERVALIEKKGFGYYMGFEPMTHRRIKWENWYGFEVFLPDAPNVDLCHGGNLTRKRWSTDKFIRKPKFWQESDVGHIPGWPDLPEIVSEFCGVHCA